VTKFDVIGLHPPEIQLTGLGRSIRLFDLAYPAKDDPKLLLHIEYGVSAQTTPYYLLIF
jgi:hypothetical protein